MVTAEQSIALRRTANIAAAIAAGVRIGIGSDWSPSGSKNLLGELKVAWLVAQQIGGIARHDIIAMATRTAAKILGWGSVLGTIEPGKLADLIVVDGTSQDPYDQLIRAKETDITLVVINGVPRFGRSAGRAGSGRTAAGRPRGLAAWRLAPGSRGGIRFRRQCRVRAVRGDAAPEGPGSHDPAAAEVDGGRLDHRRRPPVAVVAAVGRPMGSMT